MMITSMLRKLLARDLLTGKYLKSGKYVVTPSSLSKEDVRKVWVWIHASSFSEGYAVPLGLHGRGKGSRDVLKQSKQGVLVHDASYHIVLARDWIKATSCSLKLPTGELNAAVAGESVKSFSSNLASQISEWLEARKLQRVVLVIMSKATGEVLERWNFRIETDTEVVEKGVSRETSDKEIMREIQAIMRQIASSITYLPCLDETCVFDVLAYTDTDVAVPFTWIESDPKLIANPQMVKLHAFDTKLQIFPSDFPDCKAYSSLTMSEAADLEERAQRRPPAVHIFEARMAAQQRANEGNVASQSPSIPISSKPGSSSAVGGDNSPRTNSASDISGQLGSVKAKHAIPLGLHAFSSASSEHAIDKEKEKRMLLKEWIRLKNERREKKKLTKAEEFVIRRVSDAEVSILYDKDASSKSDLGRQFHAYLLTSGAFNEDGRIGLEFRLALRRVYGCWTAREGSPEMDSRSILVRQPWPDMRVTRLCFLVNVSDHPFND